MKKAVEHHQVTFSQILHDVVYSFVFLKYIIILSLWMVFQEKFKEENKTALREIPFNTFYNIMQYLTVGGEHIYNNIINTTPVER